MSAARLRDPAAGAASRASGLVALVLVTVSAVIGNGSYELILEAAEACPAVAISILDEETSEAVFP